MVFRLDRRGGFGVKRTSRVQQAERVEWHRFGRLHGPIQSTPGLGSLLVEYSPVDW